LNIYVVYVDVNINIVLISLNDLSGFNPSQFSTEVGFSSENKNLPGVSESTKGRLCISTWKMVPERYQSGRKVRMLFDTGESKLGLEEE